MAGGPGAGAPRLTFDEFEQRAREAYQEIPEAYLDGIDGLVVSREAPTHPDYPDVFTLGQCLTEEHLSDYGSPETTRSVIALYWGSFDSLARKRPGFDWEGEIWETLTHELRHHLESLAGDDDLEEVDYAADQTFNRHEGRPFDPWYFQRGEEVGPGVYRVEQEVYVEQLWEAGAFAAAASIDFDWKGARYRVPRPEELGDVHFIYVGSPDGSGDSVEVVLVRKRAWWETFTGVFAGALTVLESEAEPRRVDG